MYPSEFSKALLVPSSGIRSKLLCTFYVHLATCKMGRKTRRNDSYIHSGKKRGAVEEEEPFTAHDRRSVVSAADK